MARHRVLSPLKRFMLRSTGYSYPNMGRLFLRLFIGIMFLQFGLRQIADYSLCKDVFPAVLGMNSEISLLLMIAIEILCSVLIMIGLCTRISCVPPFITMLIAQIYLQTDPSIGGDLMPWQQQHYLPALFMGIYFFLFLVGPGKISIDYLLSLRIIHAEDRNEDDELETV